MASTAAGEQPMALQTLSLQQLDEVRQQLEQEINGLAQNALALQQTAAKFAAAGQAVEHLQEQKQGQPVLLPLTESLYVSGTLESVESVLLDIGTGYYVERDPTGGVDYCQRKVLLVRDRMEQLSGLLRQRQGALAQVGMALEDKLAAGGPQGRQPQQQRG